MKYPFSWFFLSRFALDRSGGFLLSENSQGAFLRFFLPTLASVEIPAGKLKKRRRGCIIFIPWSVFPSPSRFASLSPVFIANTHRLIY
jgi:hypothetical protein